LWYPVGVADRKGLRPAAEEIRRGRGDAELNFSRKTIEQKAEALRADAGDRGLTAGVMAARVLLGAVLAAVCILIGLAAGAYRGIIDSAPEISDVNIMPMGYATFIYDEDGNQIEQLNSAEGNRISVSIEDIPLNMQHAIVAIEDSRFYEHNGVDPKGMVRAILVALQSGFSRTEGASTITQQLLKNNVFTGWTEESTLESITRKIQEQYLAVELEAYLTEQGEDAKSVILENYLNTVNFGAGAYGVQTAAQTYFGKDARDLTLSECAVLAAIPQNPSRWNPISHPENNAERRETVLRYMEEQGYITEAEMEEALADDVYTRIQENASRQSEENSAYSYFVDAVIEEVHDDLMTQCGYTDVQASNAIYSGGLRIYTTQDPEIQAIMDEEFRNEENYPETVDYELDWAMTVDHAAGNRQNYSREMLQAYFRNTDPSFDLLFSSQEEAQSYIDQYKSAVLGEGDTIVAERTSLSPQPQASMTVIDQHTGQVKGIVGGRGEKTASLTLNRATDTTRQPGSTFKILSTYGPALDEGEITLATQIEDEPYEYADGTPLHNDDNRYHGEVTVREAIQNSYNIPAVKVLTEITPRTGYDYLLRLGITTLDPDRDVIQPLAIGGITNGVTNLELTAAYAAVANGGVYIEPTFYTKVTDQEGNVLLESTPQETRVFKESTAYLLTSAMESVISDGTGQAYQLDGMTTAGKTGTTNDYYDLNFVGYTPYYTAAVWAGYDLNAEVPEAYRNIRQVLWTKVMNRIHEELPDKEFEQPSTVVQRKVCLDSGLLAGLGCSHTRTEYFDADTAPQKRCTEHIPILGPIISELTGGDDEEEQAQESTAGEDREETSEEEPEDTSGDREDSGEESTQQNGENESAGNAADEEEEPEAQPD
jgi:penicillin-binding protein 1A